MMIFDSHRDGIDMYTSNIRRAVEFDTEIVTSSGDGYDLFSVARQPRKNLNTLEPTLTLDHLLCKFLVRCSLQTYLSFFLYEVVV